MCHTQFCGWESNCEWKRAKTPFKTWILLWGAHMCTYTHTHNQKNKGRGGTSFQRSIEILTGRPGHFSSSLTQSHQCISHSSLHGVDLVVLSTLWWCRPPHFMLIGWGKWDQCACSPVFTRHPKKQHIGRGGEHWAGLPLHVLFFICLSVFHLPLIKNGKSEEKNPRSLSVTRSLGGERRVNSVIRTRDWLCAGV